MNNEELVKRIRDGDSVTECLQVLYERNLPMIKQFIKPYTCYETESDLLQEAFFGIWEACKHYESDENVKFLTYAKYWIRRSVWRYIENCGSLIKTHFNFGQKITLISLDAPLPDGESCLSDTIASDSRPDEEVIGKLYNEQVKNDLSDVLERYTGKQQAHLLQEYYGAGKSLRQIAEENGLSLEEVRRRKRSAINQMRRGEALRELKERLEILDASSYRTSLKGFREHGDSSVVEHIAIGRMEIEQKFSNVYSEQ